MTAPAPTTCQTCEGEGWLDITEYAIDAAHVEIACPDCQHVCVICDQPRTDVIDGTCGTCWDDDERAARRRSA